MKPAGLYIHVPFCSSVCPYCDFAVTIAGPERRDGYLAALEREIAGGREHGFRFDTVYFGGGTPSLLEAEQIAGVLEVANRRLDIDTGAALHLEINPDHVDPGRARRWRELGFSFASIGVQSFDDDELVFLGRRHTAAVAGRAVEILLAADFPTVSVDLVFGLPGQRPEAWRRRLETVLELGVHHLSCYQLTIHEGTVFGRRRARGELGELGEDAQAELYLLIHEVLGAAGWQAYEVSNFAASDEHRSRHNRKYWDHSPYLGLGPSAHSFDGCTRWWNRRRLRLWAAELAAGRTPVEGRERLSAAELFFEAVMLGLRTADGIDPAALRARFGDEIAVLDDPAVDRLVASGHLRRQGARLIPTPRGMAIAEGLVKSILP